MSTQSAAAHGWTYEEYARLPDDGNRYEVIAGKLYVTPPPETSHQEASARFFMEMRDHATRRHALGLVLYAPVAVLLGDGDYLEPDIVFLRREHEHYRTAPSRVRRTSSSRSCRPRRRGGTVASSASATRISACPSTGSWIRTGGAWKSTGCRRIPIIPAWWPGD